MVYFYFTNNIIIKINEILLDILEMFPTIKLVSENKRKDEETLAILLGLLGTIKPRPYSIGNSMEAHPDTIRVIYKVFIIAP